MPAKTTAPSSSDYSSVKGDPLSSTPQDSSGHYDIEFGEVVAGDSGSGGGVGLSGGALSAKMLHIGFIRKVYGILAVQLSLTACIAYACTLGDRVAFIHAFSILQWPLFFLNIGLLIATYVLRKRTPVNLILLFTWTSVLALSLGAVSAQYVEAGQSALLFEAAGITGVTFLSLTLFAFQSKIDFTFLRAGLYVGLHIMFFYGVLSLIIGLSLPLVYSWFGVMLFSGYILFDTSRLINRFEPDEYIDAAIQLYLDIINMFLYILRILGKKK